uniref:Bystin n=1 Tax=Steinernema glaseri TaxID=37863 RepID=A0A1I7ZJW2_9BILA
MGKKNRCRTAKGDQVSESLPLDQQVERSNVARPRGVPRVKKQTLKRDREPDQYISEDLSAKILKTARAQKRSEEAEDKPAEAAFTIGRARQQSLGGISMGDVSDFEEEEEVIEYDDEIVQLDPEDEKAMEMFLLKREDAPKTRTLFDIIQDKIEQKKMEIETQMSQADNTQIRDMDPQVEQMFRDIGVVLTRYRSGKIPKAFKVIPNMVNWEQVLYLTNPDKWSAAAMYQATRLFASNLNPKMCQRFYNLVLLPRLRDDIDEYKKLNFHLYQALHKSLYKPAAFFKGILLPLIESGT